MPAQEQINEINTVLVEIEDNEDKNMVSRAQEQINQINTVLVEIADIDRANIKYQLEIYKVFYANVKQIMGV